MKPPDPISTAEIDLGALANNCRVIRDIVGPKTFVMAALKADAYGFGLIPVAKTMAESGVDGFALVNIQDAVRLRQAGIGSPILLYAGTVAEPKTIQVVLSNRLMPTLVDFDQARPYSEQASSPVRCFVKVDVGLQRIGVAPEEAAGFIQRIGRLPRIVVEGLYTHFHVPSVPRVEAYLEWQYSRFLDVLEEVARSGINVPITLAASSAVLLHSRSMVLNAVDPGRLFYGLLASTSMFSTAQLRPALRRITSRLVQVKTLSARSDFNDLEPFAVTPGMRLGIIPVGRADGVLSFASDHVLVRGRPARIVVRPSLEHTRVDLTDIPDAVAGDEVVFLGRQGDAAIDPHHVAENLGIDPGELAVGIRGSIARTYVDATAK